MLGVANDAGACPNTYSMLLQLVILVTCQCKLAFSCEKCLSEIRSGEVGSPYIYCSFATRLRVCWCLPSSVQDGSFGCTVLCVSKTCTAWWVYLWRDTYLREREQPGHERAGQPHGQLCHAAACRRLPQRGGKADASAMLQSLSERPSSYEYRPKWQRQV